MFDMKRTQQMTDIVHGTIQYSGIESAVISTPIFNRLHRILQSSMVYLTYSSNKVKRFEHSVGTMHLAGKILYNSVANTNDDQIVLGFMKEVQEEIVKWYQSIDFTTNDFLRYEIADQCPPEGDEVLKAPVPDCTFYRENTPGNICDNQRFAFLVVFQAVRIAALLHDVGHLPYSHILEHTFEALYRKVATVEEEKRTGAQEEFLKIIALYYDAQKGTGEEIKAIHEAIGAKLFEQIESGIKSSYPKRIDIERIFLAAVFDFAANILKSNPMENNIFSDLHRIVAGTVDADRMDYCCRDALCAGFKKDVFPYERILCTYRICRKALDIDEGQGDRERVLFCPSAKMLFDVEELLERRRIIFERINYHHRVHKHEVLFSEVLVNIGMKELESLNVLPSISLNASLPMQLSSIYVLLKKLQDKRTRIDYLIIQLDDSWLDTLLKNAFFSEYKRFFRDTAKYGNEPEWNRFDELISASKHYHSAFKKSTDFYAFDSVFGAKWKEVADYQNMEKSSLTYKSLATANAIIDTIKAKKSSGSFVFNYLVDAFALDDGVLHKIEGRLNERLQQAENEKICVRDCLIKSCKFSLGYDTTMNPVCFWTEDGNLLDLDEISVQRNHFINIRKISTPCHLYYLPRFDESNLQRQGVNKEALLELLADTAASVIWEEIAQKTHEAVDFAKAT